MSPKLYSTHQHYDTIMCWKCLRLTFSSDLKEAMFETGSKVCLPSKINSVPENIQLIYIKSNRIRSIHAHIDFV